MSGNSKPGGNTGKGPSQERAKTPAGAKPGSSEIGSVGPTTRGKGLSRLDKALAEVVTREDAEKVLNAGGWAVIGQTWTAGAVSQLILQMTNMVDPRDAQLVKALAIVVMGMAEDDTASKVANVVMTALEEPLKKFKEQQLKHDKRTEEMEDFSSNVASCTGELQNEMVALQVKVQETSKTWQAAEEALSTATEGLKRTVKGMQKESTNRESAATKENERRRQNEQEDARKVEESAKRAEEAAKQAESQRKLVVEEAAKRIEEVVAAARASPEMGGAAVPVSSYAGVVKSTPSAKLAMERTDERNKKVLFFRLGNRELIERHEPEELLLKANRALDAIKENGVEVPEGVTFMGAKTLEKGDVVYDMRSKEAAVWLKANRVAFLTGFGAHLGMKGEEYAMIVENVPVGFSANQEALDGAEGLNELDKGSILSFKWIKPANQRRLGQRTAFATVKVSTAEMANKLIRKGFYAGGRNNKTRKVVAEVQRCYKCQRLNPRHVANTCPCKHEVCEYCGENHRASACEVRGQDPAQHWCANCKHHGHGAGDRMCPAMQKATKAVNTRAPENMFKYFLLEGDEETLERLYADENGEYGGGNSYTKSIAEGWSDVRQSEGKDYSNGATGWTSGESEVAEPAWGAQPRAPGGWGRRGKRVVDDEAEEIREQTKKKKERDAAKVRNDNEEVRAKAREDARVEQRVANERAEFNAKLALVAAGILTAEEMSAAAKAGLAPGEKLIEGNTWGAGFEGEAGAKEGETDNLNPVGNGATKTTSINTNTDSNNSTNTNTKDNDGRQGHGSV